MLERSTPSAVGEETEVADANQTPGQNVEEETAQELMGGNGHDLLLATVGVVSPAERDAIVLEGHEAMVNLAKALNSGGIPIGPGLHEQQINGGQVITDLGWLNQTWIADRIGAQLSTAQANVNNDQPGLHGHSLNSVTVDGTTLQAGITNDVPADKAQNWVLSLTNGGDFNEFDVGCSVKIVALSDEGTGVVPETYAHQGATCNVKLPSIPNTGPYQVIATIDKVPGETNLTNNTLTYNVDFT